MSYTIPLGPYHPSLEEPIHAKLYTEGEIIKDADVFIGYNHRGIEKLATERNFIQTIVLVERVCGICSHSHPFTYSMAIEKISNMEVPKRGQYIRVIIAELERLHSHYLWLGLVCHLIGFDSMFMNIWNTREKIMDVLEEISGNRVNYAMITIGGARRDIDSNKKEKVITMVNEILESNKRLKEIFTSDKTILLRTKKVGLLSKDDAKRIGTVGPHARASGLNIDVRKDAPYSSYEDFDFNVPVIDDGDVWSRVVIRLLEVEESIKIIKQALENIPDGPINLGMKIPKVPAGEFTARHEAPRGEVSYFVVTDGGPTNYRISIHVPTFKTAPTIPFMMKNNTVADAGVIVGCIDPCFSCLDR